MIFKPEVSKRIFGKVPEKNDYFWKLFEIKISPLVLENSFYKDINKNKIFFKLRGKSNQTYLYNINYGIVNANISETRAYEAIKDKIIELPDIEIKQKELGILGQDDKIEIIIPNNIAAEWDNSNWRFKL